VNAGFGGRRRTAAIRARMTPRPFGFLLLSVSAVCCALGGLGGVVGTDFGEGPGGLALFRALFGLVAAASLLAAEALWWVRPWAFRATAAMLLSITMAVAAVFFEADGWEGLGAGSPFLVGLAILAWAVLPYVHRRSTSLSAAGKVAAAPRAPTRGTP
jgi:hypothetical protein